jgi:hypothetical protein
MSPFTLKQRRATKQRAVQPEALDCVAPHHSADTHRTAHLTFSPSSRTHDTSSQTSHRPASPRGAPGRFAERHCSGATGRTRRPRCLVPTQAAADASPKLLASVPEQCPLPGLAMTRIFPNSVPNALHFLPGHRFVHTIIIFKM